MGAEAKATERRRRRRLVALGAMGGLGGFAVATAALSWWPGAGTAGVLAALLGVPLLVGWRAEPEAEMQEEADPEADPWEALVRTALEPGGALRRAIEEAVQEPRRDRGIGSLRIAEWSVAPAPDGVSGRRGVVRGRWSVPWSRHPVPGHGNAAFEELGTFRGEVRRAGEGALEVTAMASRSDFFETLLPWVTIPAGSFLMGSPEDDEEGYEDERPQHPEQVAAFVLGATQVTEGQVAAVTGKAVTPEQADLPVTEVSWEDALDFCNTLSRLAGRRPCYVRTSNEVFWDRAADGFRLPEESEWEYACRAGTTTRYSFGDDARRLGEFAWFAENSGVQAHPVGQKKPNPWNLYDMHGNVWEWVWDVYKYSYTDKVTSDNHNDKVTSDKPHPLRSPVGGGRVVRGGSFGHGPEKLRSAFRGGDGPGDRDWSVGFRCAGPVRRQLDPSSA